MPPAEFQYPLRKSFISGNRGCIA